MSAKPQSRHTSDPLLQERPARKKRRLSNSPADDSEEGSNSSADLIHSDPDYNHFQIHSDFTVEDRLSSSGQHGRSSIPRKLAPAPVSFSSLGISTLLQSALKSMSIKSPTEIQVACIPPLLAGMCIFYFLKVRGVELAAKQVGIVSEMPKLVLEKRSHLHCQSFRNFQSILMEYLPWC